MADVRQGLNAPDIERWTDNQPLASQPVSRTSRIKPKLLQLKYHSFDIVYI